MSVQLSEREKIDQINTMHALVFEITSICFFPRKKEILSRSLPYLLILRLLVLSADNLCKQFGPRPGLTNDTDGISERIFQKS